MSWLSRFVSVIRSDRLNRDLDDEMRFHLEERTEEYTRAGLSIEEASARARREFGSPPLMRDESRDIKLLPRIESIFRDVSFALRMWRRNKLATGAALVSLSLAIGACTAAFSLIDALILRTLPVDDPQTLIYVALRSPAEARDGLSFNYPLFREMRAASSGQVRLFAVSDQARRDAVFDDSGQVEKVYGQWVSGDAFAILGVKPALGRVLASTDDINPGQHPVAVLSYDFWTRRFASNPDVLGRWVTIREKPLQIVGVAAKGFTGVEPGIMTDVWAPTMMWDDRAISDPDTRWFRIWGRMQAGVAQEQAHTVLQSVFASFARDQVARRPEESGDRLQQFLQHSCPPAIGRHRYIRAPRELRARIVGARRPRRFGAARRLHERREPVGGPRGCPATRDGAAGIDWRRTWPIDPAGVDRERTVGARFMRAGRNIFSRRDAEDRVDDVGGGGERAPRGRGQTGESSCSSAASASS